MKLNKFFYLLVTLSFTMATKGFCAEQKPKCSVPANSIRKQVNDFCFLQFGTDDIAHPAVQSCLMLLLELKNDCKNRVKLKEYRCYLLKSQNSIENDMTIKECMNSKETEGSFVKGCTYPFEEGCDKTHN